MKLIKKINNNFVLAEDSAGNQVIVEGKGIGFTIGNIESRNHPLMREYTREMRVDIVK